MRSAVSSYWQLAGDPGPKAWFWHAMSPAAPITYRVAAGPRCSTRWRAAQGPGCSVASEWITEPATASTASTARALRIRPMLPTITTEAVRRAYQGSLRRTLRVERRSAGRQRPMRGRTRMHLRDGDPIGGDGRGDGARRGELRRRRSGVGAPSVRVRDRIDVRVGIRVDGCRLRVRLVRS